MAIIARSMQKENVESAVYDNFTARSTPYFTFLSTYCCPHREHDDRQTDLDLFLQSFQLIYSALGWTVQRIGRTRTGRWEARPGCVAVPFYASDASHAVGQGPTDESFVGPFDYQVVVAGSTSPDWKCEMAWDLDLALMELVDGQGAGWTLAMNQIRALPGQTSDHEPLVQSFGRWTVNRRRKLKI